VSLQHSPRHPNFLGVEVQNLKERERYKREGRKGEKGKKEKDREGRKEKGGERGETSVMPARQIFLSTHTICVAVFEL